MIHLSVVPQKVKILKAIFLVVKDHLLIVAPLRDMMCRPGDYDAC
jgi:hypothetical protein